MLTEVNIHRVQSDSNLNKIDKKRTFNEANEQIQPNDLIARVFNALGNIKAAEDDIQSSLNDGGFHGFSDSQILAGEKQLDSRWSISYSDSSYAVPPKTNRSRAASDFHAPIKDPFYSNKEHEWTWSGNNSQIEEFLRLRKMNKRKSKDLYRASFALPPQQSSKNDNVFTINIDDPISQNIPQNTSTPSIFKRLNPFKKYDNSRRNSTLPDRSEVENYLNQTSAGRASRNISQAKRRASTFSIFSATDEHSADVLENTTIADLIRALEVMHTQTVAGDTPLLEDFFENPKRKVGNAGFAQTATSNQQSPMPSINIFPPSTPTQKQNRRSSLRPFTSGANTPLFNRSKRRQSLFLENSHSSRRSSVLIPPSQPPPYSETTSNVQKQHRRFSVRPTMLSIPPGQSSMPSIQASSSLQRRLSMRPSYGPSPLLNDYYTNKPSNNSRYNRSISTGSSNYSASSIENPLSRNSSNILTPVNESQSNTTQRRSSQPQPSSTATNRRRCESK